MSQEGVIDIIGTHPEIPTLFIANVGFAIPIANTLELLGEVIAAGSIPFESVASGNTVTYQVQLSQAIASTNAANVGLSAFNSVDFSVDANGFVSLIGGGAAVDSFAMQTGTSPVVPNGAGLVTFNGAVVANGTNPVRTDGTAPTTMALEVQISAAIAATDASRIGLSAFDSARFTVDVNGFVSINGAGIGETITGNSGGALSPTAGNWNIFGATVAAGTTPVATSGSGSTLTTNVQISQAIASTNVTNIGLAAFSSVHFAVDANGFVTLAGGGQAIDSIAVQTGTSPVVPTVAGLVTFNGAVVAAGTNPVRSDGTGANTYALEVQISQAIASTNATNIGLSAFNSAHFTVDANGFVSSVAGVFTWIDQGTSITLAVNTGYFVTAATTQTLPAAPTQGQVVKIVADTTGAVVVTANTGQLIRSGTTVSSTAGTFTSTLQGDSLELVFRAATSTWISIATNGVWVPA